jgi:hypothetical protein
VGFFFHRFSSTPIGRVLGPSGAADSRRKESQPGPQTPQANSLKPPDELEDSLVKRNRPRFNQTAASKTKGGLATKPEGNPIQAAKQVRKEVEQHDFGVQPNAVYPVPIIIESEHAQRRIVTAAAWEKLLPQLVYPLMQWMHNKGGESSMSPACSCIQKVAEVRVISFTCEPPCLALKV